MTDPRPRVVQIGGAGPIAGGLSQVVEQLAAHPFDGLVATAHPTRDAGSAWGTARRVVTVAVHLATSRPTRTSRPGLLAVHVSQRGSFLREGALARLAGALGWPYVVHVHGSEFVAFARARPRLVRWVLGRSRAVLVLSDEASREVDGFCRARGEAVRIVNTVEIPEPSPTTHSVVFGGTLSTRKGVDVLLDAWQRLPDRRDWQLDLYGPVAMELPPLPPGVTVHGAVDRRVLLEALRRSAVAVLPSRAEQMPMFLLEAMAAGNAVVATPVGAVSALLEDGAGVEVPPGDVAALAAALAALLSDEPQIARLAAAARDRVATRHDHATAMRSVSDVWQAAMS